MDVFCAIYAESVPPDGLEEVYRLHERARGGLPHLEVRHGHPHSHAPDGPDELTGIAGRVRERRGRVREAPG